MDEYKNLVNQKTSALSSVGNANRQAMKYADNTALAQGYATQGAMLQNTANLQNAYQNQVGNINQQFQQQLGDLKNTASTNALTQYTNRLANLVENTTLTDEQRQSQLNSLQNAYYGQMSANDIKEAQFNTQDVLQSLNGAENAQASYDDNKKLESATSTSEKNNVEYRADFPNGTQNNKNFRVTVNGETYKVELGVPAGNYLKGVYNSTVYEDAKDRAVGEIWEVKNDEGKSVIVIKTGNRRKDIRVIERAGVKANDYAKLMNALGYSGRTKAKGKASTD